MLRLTYIESFMIAIRIGLVDQILHLNRQTLNRVFHASHFVCRPNEPHRLSRGVVQVSMVLREPDAALKRH